MMRNRSELKTEYSEWKKDNILFTKRTLHFFIAAVILLFLTFFSLLRANFNYIDDIGHVITGYPEWAQNFGRYILWIENVLVQMNFLLDISPFNQIISIILLSASVVITSCVMSKIAGEDRLELRFFIPSLIIAFNPYFLECMSYKYESIGMSTSVLFGVLPFVFLGKNKLFYLTSFISTILLCMSYQASSGIFIVFVILLGILMYAKEEYSIKELLKFYLFSAVAYITAMGLYYAIFSPFMDPYRSIDVAESQNLISMVISNGREYIRSISYDFPLSWKIASILTVVSSIVAVIKFSKKKIVSTILFIALLALALVLSAGAYIALSSFAGAARMLYGFGIFLSIVANIAVINKGGNKTSKVLFRFAPFILAWLFFVYAFGFGNLLAAQDEYEKSFEMRILSDLNTVLEPSDQDYNIMIEGSVGLSAQGRLANSLYPITSRLVPSTLSGRWWWSGNRLRNYYGEGFYYAGETYQINREDFELIAERLYYDIYINNNDILIDFNEDMLY